MQIRRTILACVCVALVSVPAFARKKKAEAQPNLVEIACHDVAVVGKLAYLARNDGLAVFDVADPAVPEQIARLSLPATQGLTLDGDRVYLAGGSHGLHVADLSIPDRPSLIATHDTPGRVLDVRIRGKYAFLADHRQGLTVVDLSRPDRPQTAATVPTRGEVRAVALRGDLLATAEGTAGIRLFDVSRPQAPRELRAPRFDERVRDVEFVGELLLVAGGRSISAYRLPNTNRGEPLPAGRYETEENAEFLSVSGNRVTASIGGTRLALLQLPGSGELRADATVRLPGGIYVGRVDIVDGLAFIASGRRGLSIVDVSVEGEPVVLLPRSKRLKISFP